MRMIQLPDCPACSDTKIREIYPYNDLVYRSEPEARAIDTSCFCACDTCGLFFARRRQHLDSVTEFYAHFAQFENRHYAVYPPADNYVRGKEKTATRICMLLEERGLLKQDLEVLHARCDCGTLLAMLRERYGVSRLFGLDYFDSNIRYAGEVLSLPNIAKLDAGRFVDAFDRRFDLIVSNHMITHALEPLRFCATVRGLLKPGGVVFFYNEPDHETLMAKESQQLDWGINAFHKQLLTRLSLGGILRRAGFQFDAVCTQGPWLEALARPAPVPVAAVDADAAEVARLTATFMAWARRHERLRRARRLRSLVATWSGAKRLKRALTGRGAPR